MTDAERLREIAGDINRWLHLKGGEPIPYSVSEDIGEFESRIRSIAARLEAREAFTKAAEEYAEDHLQDTYTVADRSYRLSELLAAYRAMKEAERA